MIFPIGGRKGFAVLADEVQLLMGSQPKPRAGKSEGRTRNRVEPQREPVKLTAALNIRDVDGNVIKLKDCHGAGRILARSPGARQLKVGWDSMDWFRRGHLAGPVC